MLRLCSQAVKRSQWCMIRSGLQRNQALLLQPKQAMALFVPMEDGLRHSSSGRPRRRRRMGDSDINTTMEDSNDTQESRKKTKRMDREWFVQMGKVCLVEVENALEPMIPINDVFVIKKGGNELGDYLQLRLSPNIGTYVIQIDEVSQIMTLTSPKSGMYTYLYDTRTNEWVGADDGHSFKGMLTRDLIQQCQGLPNF